MNYHRTLKSAVAALAVAVPLCWSSIANAQDAVNLRMTIWSANEAHLKLFSDIAAGFKKTIRTSR